MGKCGRGNNPVGVELLCGRQGHGVLSFVRRGMKYCCNGWAEMSGEGTAVRDVLVESQEVMQGGVMVVCDP
jgi:hypothetical protein